MNKKMRNFLLVFTSIVLLIIGMLMLKEKKVSTSKDINISKAEKNLFIETSEVRKNDKDFYKISVKKNTKPLDVHKGKIVSNFILQMQRLLGMKTADISKLDQTMHAFLILSGIIPRPLGRNLVI